MAAKFVSKRNLKFMLFEVFDAAAMTHHDYYQEHTPQAFDLILEATHKIAETLCRPVLQDMDTHPPALDSDQVRVHPAVRKFMRESGQGGWIAAGFPHAVDGEQLPHLLIGACEYIYAAANFSLSVYPTLTAGAADLIVTFGSQALIDAYVPRMLAGEWQGTMALTEPQAGSSLSDITTEALPTEEDYYRIQGQKIFISAGDHNGVDNVVHLLLAKIKGAPSGVKGISLFVVPKLRMDKDGALVSNDVATSQVYHKMGYRGCPITELVFGQNQNCRGYLVGEPHKGLAYMFQMMNGARINVGTCATAIAQAAYGESLEYARLRPQGRRMGQKDPLQPQVPIIEHTDVKRMLMFQRAVVEGALSLLLQCQQYTDLKQVSHGEDCQRYDLLLEILTPVAKTYPSEMGQFAVSNGLQCLGGYGYCQDFALEQYFRDIRIHPIHEGTTGIQGLDLLGRKVRMQDGRALQCYVNEVQKTIDEANSFTELTSLAGALDAALNKLLQVTDALTTQLSQKGPETALADATVYLELFGTVAVAWQWLIQALAILEKQTTKLSPSDQRFYAGKLLTCRFYYKYELPKTEGLVLTLLADQPLTVEMKAAYFKD